MLACFVRNRKSVWRATDARWMIESQSEPSVVVRLSGDHLQLRKFPGMQKVTIECAPTDFYCSVTGDQILSESGCQPSPATVFVFVTEADEFEHIDAEYTAASEQAESHEDDDIELIDRFLLLIADKKIIVFHLCGQFFGDPDCYIGIDFSKVP
jgi:hypothetical protein